MPLIQFDSIDKVYHSGRIDFHALRQISFAVDSGEFTAIAGPSGSGKTTILNIIGCLDKASAGSYIFAGEDISKKSENELANLRRKSLGFIFQTFNLIPVLTAYENVEFPLLMTGNLNPKNRNEWVENILEEVGLKDFMHRKPSELSGGQQQRVAIARALVKKPSLILADEPTANLDSQNGREILSMMTEINTKHGTTFLFSTHDQMVMDFAGRVIMLMDGQIYSDEKKR